MAWYLTFMLKRGAYRHCQLTIYLRLKGAKVPSIDGASGNSQ